MDDAPPIRVNLQCRPPATTVWLEVSYEGTDPPVDLFADLAMIGWHPPAPASPPASAIDWAADDLAPGERFRIRPWRVTGALVEPPHGSARRGGWTPGEREAFLVPLAGVLRRHGLADGVVGLPSAGGHPPAQKPGSPLPPPPAAATDPPPAEPAATPEPGSTVVVTAVVAPASRHLEVAEALGPLAVPFHFAEVQRMVTSSYRGSTFETPTTVLQMQALVAAATADRVAEVLRSCGCEPTVGPPAPSPDPGDRTTEGSATGTAGSG